MPRSPLGTSHDWHDLGVRIKELREAAQQSQSELGQALNLSAGYIAAIEAGHHRPKKQRLRQLAQALHTSYEELAQLAGYVAAP
jgi:transcriptional regulator with XRE-family HTH domain